MRKSRFSEEQIIGILKERQAGVGAKEFCRKHGISDGTSYKRRSIERDCSQQANVNRSNVNSINYLR